MLQGPVGPAGPPGPPGIHEPSSKDDDVKIHEFYSSQRDDVDAIEVRQCTLAVMQRRATTTCKDRTKEYTILQVPTDFDSDSVQVQLFDKMGSILSPVGSKDNPAMSCQDIYTNGASFKPGKYWIDPNEGSAKDAIEVYCKGPETCLTPTKEVCLHFVCGDHSLTLCDNYL